MNVCCVLGEPSQRNASAETAEVIQISTVFVYSMFELTNLFSFDFVISVLFNFVYYIHAFDDVLF